MDNESPKFWRNLSAIAAFVIAVGCLLLVSGRNSRPNATDLAGGDTTCTIDGKPVPCSEVPGTLQPSQNSLRQSNDADTQAFFGGLLVFVGLGISLYAGFRLNEIKNAVLDYQYEQMRAIPNTIRSNSDGEGIARKTCPACGHINSPYASAYAACGQPLATA